MNQIKRKFLLFGLIWVWLNLLVFSSSAAFEFPSNYEDENSAMVLQGTAVKGFFMMKAFLAALYGEPANKLEDILSDVPKRIEVYYFLSIPGEGLVNETKRSMRLNTTKDEFSQLEARISQMYVLFPNLRPRDRYSITYIPGTGTKFVYNDQLMGTIPGEDFAKTLFSVWIGKKPLDAKIKSDLLAKTKTARISLGQMNTAETTQLDVERSKYRFVRVGMKRDQFLKLHPKSKARTYRSAGNQEWLSYNFMTFKKTDVITFQLTDGLISGWSINDRPEIVEEYLSEFCSQSFIQSYPKISRALHAALNKIPWNVFWAITGRSRPVLFTEYHYTDVGRFANSSEIWTSEDDAPTFTKGMTIIKLSTELEDAESVESIEGVVLHELAHRFLEHAKKKDLAVCQREMEANQLVKEWGFEQEFKAAKERFGHKGAVQNCEAEKQ